LQLQLELQQLQQLSGRKSTVLVAVKAHIRQARQLADLTLAGKHYRLPAAQDLQPYPKQHPITTSNMNALLILYQGFVTNWTATMILQRETEEKARQPETKLGAITHTPQCKARQGLQQYLSTISGHKRDVLA
jgi:hypothetical protein